MELECVVVEEDNGDYVHIRDGTGNMLVTLCGFCDIPGDIKYVQQKPTCPSCLELVRYCKALHLPLVPRKTKRDNKIRRYAKKHRNYSHQEIANEFGICRSNVTRILKEGKAK